MLVFCVFVAGTFRPTTTGAVLAGGSIAAIIGAMIWDISAQPTLIAYDYTRWSSHGSQLSVALPFGWSAVESLLLWSRGRKRLALGLANALDVQRFLLWAVTTASFVAVCLLAIGAGEAQRVGLSSLSTWAHGVRGALYFVITACIWRGIFPGLSSTEEGRASRGEPLPN